MHQKQPAPNVAFMNCISSIQELNSIEKANRWILPHLGQIPYLLTIHIVMSCQASGQMHLLVQIWCHVKQDISKCSSTRCQSCLHCTKIPRSFLSMMEGGSELVVRLLKMSLPQSFHSDPLPHKLQLWSQLQKKNQILDHILDSGDLT